MRYDFNGIKTNGYESIVLTLKGDGKSYQFRLKESTNQRHSYVKTFETTGIKQEIVIPLVDDGLSRFDCDDFAFDHCALFGRVNLEAFLQKGFEFFHCYACHVALIPYVYVSGRAVVSAGLELHWSY